MNYPDIETCRAIGGEFLESEFVWVEDDYRYEIIKVIKRSETFVTWIEILAPAPTCEDLGVWLVRYMLRKANSSHFEFLLAHQTKFLKSMNAALFTSCMAGGADNETQARAEAVKLILERKK